ncbi:MAG: InlB B-repeat-containing protein [Burkholderiales bacterium]|jgi:uncharacterized repeat protein (TIGR02543 family)|nr:InlB B-repeat-containing protein [Burkholderiales bacterium]
MKTINKALSLLSVFFAAVSIAAVSSATAQAQTITLNGLPFSGSLNDAVATANTAGSGTIELSAGTFVITKALYIGSNIDITGVTAADGQPFDLRTSQGDGRYLVTVSNVVPAPPATVANFTNIKVVAGDSSACIRGGGTASCTLGAFNYVVGNTSGSVSGTLTNCVATGGSIGLVINNGGSSTPGTSTVTADGFAVADHSWGAGVNVGTNGLLIIGDGGITAATGVPSPGPMAAYGDSATAMVQFPGGNTETLDPTTTPPSVVYIFAFDPNGGSFGGSAGAKQVNQYSNDLAITPANPPTRAGYAFTGWYTDTQGTTLRDVNALPTGNTTLFAGWTKAGGTASVPVLGGGTLAALGILLVGLAVRTLRRSGAR